MQFESFPFEAFDRRLAVPWFKGRKHVRLKEKVAFVKGLKLADG